ncbi:radical SAM protein [Oceanotoga teriensis]|uniref:radical SAM protein n=1 Tax=Oceanotoga teriensis TaxID=515440 RepID=UPI00352BEA7C
MFVLNKYKYIFGPVPSRRMGLSLGVSPIPKGHCNYSCVYCQLGRTTSMTNEIKNFYDSKEIVNEVKDYLRNGFNFDVLTLVGEGEPLLYSNIDDLISELKKITKKPIALITNGALLSDKNIREKIKDIDILLPSLDSYNQEMLRKINRPYGKIIFEDSVLGLEKFSKNFDGQIWIEIMLIKNINDDKNSILEFKKILEKIKYDKVYINVPVRPPAEEWVQIPDEENINFAVNELDGISMESLASEGFYSEEIDDLEAIISIIKRHPMNQFEIKSFLIERKNEKPQEILDKLDIDEKIIKIDYKGYKNYRIK